jgi:hypothetical protein
MRSVIRFHVSPIRSPTISVATAIIKCSILPPDRRDLFATLLRFEEPALPAVEPSRGSVSYRRGLRDNITKDSTVLIVPYFLDESLIHNAALCHPFQGRPDRWPAFHVSRVQPVLVGA